MTDKKNIQQSRIRPQFYEVKARSDLKDVVLKEDLKIRIKVVGAISRMWLESGWQTQYQKSELVEPSPHYDAIAQIYNSCMQEALAGKPTLGEFRERILEQEAKLPAMLMEKLKEKNPPFSQEQADAVTHLCHDHCDRLVVGHLVTHMEASNRGKGGR